MAVCGPGPASAWLRILRHEPGDIPIALSQRHKAAYATAQGFANGTLLQFADAGVRDHAHGVSSSYHYWDVVMRFSGEGQPCRGHPKDCSGEGTWQLVAEDDDLRNWWSD